MRVLKLEDESFELELHPAVTVIEGLAPHQRDRIVAALGGLTSGEAPALGGLVEAHGILLDLDDDTVALLELQSDLDLVVRTADLPGGAETPTERALREAEATLADVQRRVDGVRTEVDGLASARASIEEALAAARQPTPGATPTDVDSHPGVAQLRADLERLAAEREHIEQRLALAQAAQAEAVQQVTIAQADVEATRQDRRAVAEACMMAAGRLEGARSGRDPFAAAAVEAARERLADLQAELETEEAAEERARAVLAQRAEASIVSDLGGADPRDVIERLEARRPELEAALFALDALDPYPIRAALDALREEAPTEMVPSPAAVALADAWAALAEQLAPLESAFAADAVVLAEARAQLDRARAELFEAEQAVRLPELDRADVDELEAAHATVLEAQDRTDGRFGGARAQKRLELAKEAELLVLDRLGFGTYADFMMGTSILHVDAVTERRLDEARRGLDEAEDAWKELQASVDAELSRAALLDRRRALRDQARALLGRDPGDDVEWALREHRIGVASTTDRSERMRAALVGAGIALADEDLGDADLIELAEVWLAEEAETGPRLALLREELARVDADLALALQQLRGRGDAGSGEDGDRTDPAARRAARLREAQAAVAAAEARRARHMHAEAEIADRQAELEVATAREQAVANDVALAEDRLQLAVAGEEAATAAVGDIEASLANVVFASDAATLDLQSVEEALRNTAGTSVEEIAELELRLQAEEHESRFAEEELTRAERELAEAAERVELARARIANPHDDAAGSGGMTTLGNIDEIEWYLLARLAAQRAVSFAGSLPLVIDRALDAVGDTDVERLLGRLERMAASVQVIVISDSDAPVRWARSVGDERAIVARVLSRGHGSGFGGGDEASPEAVPSDAP
jgi:chromosome segregation protein